MGSSELHVLFLCTGNSARSLIAESLLRDADESRFRAYSAGSRPTGRPHPMAVETLLRFGHETRSLRSKSWTEFAAPAGPPVDWVFTLCDSARDESCPALNGPVRRRHWSLPDPAAVTGSQGEQRAAFEETYQALRQRIEAIARIPWEELEVDAHDEVLDQLVKP